MISTVNNHHDSITLRCFVENDIISRWLNRGDILVCDNAVLNEKGYNYDLCNFLWET